MARLPYAGAAGYVAKSAGPQEILRGVRQVLAGGLFVCQRVMNSMITTALGLKSGTRSSPLDALTPREREIFVFLGQVARHRRGARHESKDRGSSGEACSTIPHSAWNMGVQENPSSVLGSRQDRVRDQGYATGGYTAGEEALGALRERQFDVLLTDLMMPGMGVELLAAALKIDPHVVGPMIQGR